MRTDHQPGTMRLELWHPKLKLKGSNYRSVCTRTSVEFRGISWILLVYRAMTKYRAFAESCRFAMPCWTSPLSVCRTFHVGAAWSGELAATRRSRARNLQVVAKQRLQLLPGSAVRLCSPHEKLSLSLSLYIYIHYTYIYTGMHIYIYIYIYCCFFSSFVYGSRGYTRPSWCMLMRLLALAPEARMPPNTTT